MFLHCRNEIFLKTAQAVPETYDSRSPPNELQMNDDRDFYDFFFVSVEFHEPFFAFEVEAMQNLEPSAGRSRSTVIFKGQTCFEDNTLRPVDFCLKPILDSFVVAIELNSTIRSINYVVSHGYD